MKKVILFFTAMMSVIAVHAGTYNYSFNSVRLSDALKRIAEDNPALNLNFIYNELETYSTSAKINTDSPYEALRKLVGINPVSVTMKGDRYYVEALQHGKYEYHGRLIGADGEPVAAATILLLSNNDSTVITYGFSDAEGRFRIPCDIAGVTGKFTCLGYRELRRELDDFAVGTLVMNENAVLLNQITVSADHVIRELDRQVITPTDRQRKASSNGVNLILALNLPRISVNILTNSISIDGKDAVQLRINGAEVTNEEVLALNPREIIRVEYIDNPGLQYNGAKAVINYIVKYPTSGGNLNGDLTQAVNYKGWGNHNIAGRYNTEKSIFNAVVNWERRDQRWIRQNEETYHFTDRTITNKEVGDDTPLKYDQLKTSLRYVWQDAEKQMLSVNFRHYYKDEPNSFSDRNSTLYQGDNQYRIFDNTTAKLNIPSLDIYYQLSLPHKQNLYFDVVGSYLDSRNKHTYRMNHDETVIDSFYSDIEGTKWSLFGEGIYERDLGAGKLSGGIRQRQEWVKNIYSGVADNEVRMISSRTNAYAEFQARLKQVNYSVGLGTLRTYSHQDGHHLEKYIFNPRLNLSWGAVKGLFMRFNAEISGYAPSLADLSSVTQQIDAYQARRGNPDLKAVTYYSATTMINWDICKFMGIGNYTVYNYDHRPVMEQDIAENNMIIRTMANQRGFHRLNSHTWIFLKPYKDYVTIRVTAQYQRFISQGETYTHTYSNLRFFGEMFATWNYWSLSFNFMTPYNDFWGETLTIGERNHNFTLRYNRQKWSAAACLYNPFEKEYKQSVRNYSAIAPYTQTVYSRKLTKVLLLKFSFNIDFGKSRGNVNQRMSSEDTNTGIMSGSR